MIDFMGNGEKEECCDFVYFDKCSPPLFLESRKLCRQFNEGHHLREIIRRLEITIVDVRTEIPKFWETNLQFVHSVILGRGIKAYELRRFSSLIKTSLAHEVEFRGITLMAGIDEKISSNLEIDQFEMHMLDPTCINTKHTVKLTECHMDNAEETVEVLGRGTIHTLVIDDCSDMTSMEELTKEGGGSGSIHTLHINHCKNLVFHTSELASINELRDTRCKWAFHDDESRHKWDDAGNLITVGGRCNQVQRRCKEGIHRTNVEATT